MDVVKQPFSEPIVSPSPEKFSNFMKKLKLSICQKFYQFEERPFRRLATARILSFFTDLSTSLVDKHGHLLTRRRYNTAFVFRLAKHASAY